MTEAVTDQIASGSRFAFGDNWQRFLRVVDDQRIADAEASLKETLEIPVLTGQRFLDVGSGSGLFSLAARRLGAVVHSFDSDPQSVLCTLEMRRRYAHNDPDWVVQQGSVLDRQFLSRLGTFDIVYAWGVLHHTGDMWRALANVAELAHDHGRLCVAIYNDQGGASRRWTLIKRTYCQSPRAIRFGLIAAVGVWFAGRATLVSLLRMQNPLPGLFLTGRHGNRGMSALHDLRDWVGGYPFEVASPEAMLMFFRQRGFILMRLATARGGHGCNEYTFQKISSLPAPDTLGTGRRATRTAASGAPTIGQS